MRGRNSESVDLIYLGTPFSSMKTYSTPIGSKAVEVSFKDFWAYDDDYDVSSGILRQVRFRLCPPV